MSIAICPGSFDPITLGHLNIIRRSSKIFDKVIVCIMYNSTKTSPMFSVEERVEMARKATEKYPNVSVESSSGLLAEYAKQYDGAVIVKGLRAASDFEYEFQMNLINKKIFAAVFKKLLCQAIQGMVGKIHMFGRNIQCVVRRVMFLDTL